MTTPNRPPLSPAAQAVLEAWVAAQRTQTRTAGRNAPLAAALRAVANQIKPTPEDYGQSPFHAHIFLNGMVYATHEILAIAAELDSQP
jgi:hypothetical protein